MTHLTSESLPSTTSQLDFDDKLEQCCQRLEQLSNKVDRFISFEQTGIELNFFFEKQKRERIIFLGVIHRQSRPSPNTASSVDLVTTNEPQVNLTDAHYDRLETILTEKIQAHVQTGKRDAKTKTFCTFLFSSSNEISLRTLSRYQR